MLKCAFVKNSNYGLGPDFLLASTVIVPITNILQNQNYFGSAQNDRK